MRGIRTNVNCCHTSSLTDKEILNVKVKNGVKNGAETKLAQSFSHVVGGVRWMTCLLPACVRETITWITKRTTLYYYRLLQCMLHTVGLLK